MSNYCQRIKLHVIEYLNKISSQRDRIGGHMPKLKLICLPYSGGTADFIYYPWKRYLKKNYVEVLPLELAGRGKRIKESSITSVEETMEDLLPELTTLIADGSPYLLFGHSMGSLLVYELYYKLVENGLPSPLSLIVSAGQAPQTIEHNDNKLHQLSLNEFKTAIRDTGRIHEELFQNKKILDLYLPMLYADYKLVETYKYIPKDTKIKCDVYSFLGTEDTAILKRNALWKELVEKDIKEFKFDSGHYFIHEREYEVMEAVKAIIHEQLELNDIIPNS